jgi:hypothetical protein
MPHHEPARVPSRLAVGLVAAALMTAGLQSPAYAQTGTPVTPPDKTAPALTVTAPASDAAGVPVNGTVMVMFTEPVQGVDDRSFTLRGAGAAADVSAAVSYDDSTWIATLDPKADLSADTSYTVTLTGGASAIRDVAGNPLLNVSFAFTTGASVPAAPSPAPALPVPAIPAPGAR